MYHRIKVVVLSLMAFLAVWLGIRYLVPLCLPFLLGLGLALLAEPVVGFLNRRLRLPRSMAAGLGVFAAFLAVAILLLMVGAFLVRELTILAGILPDLTQTIQSGLSLLQQWALGIARRLPASIRPLLEQNAAILFSGGSSLLERAFRYVLSLAGNLLTRVPDSALTLGTGVISAFMFSARLPRIRRWLLRRFPREKIKPLLGTLGQIRSAVGGWLIAQIRLTGMTMLILLAGLWILRVPYALLWAVGISLLDALPVLGTGTVLVPWALVRFLQGDRAGMAGLLGIYVVISLTRSVLEPRLVGRQLGLDPLVTLFSLYAGYKLWGLGGIFFAPLLAVCAAQLLSGNRGTS